jgi:hypothetical protein
MSRRELMMMRTRGLSGPFFERHHGVPRLSKSASTITKFPPPPALPIFTGTIADFVLTNAVPMPTYNAAFHFNTGGAVTGWSLQNAPAWMSISTIGIISGTPNLVATTPGVTVTGTNVTGNAVSNAFSVQVDL